MKYFEDMPAQFLTSDAPGNIGSWVGLQIIEQYIKETNTTPEALMKTIMHRKYWLHQNTREDKYITDESTIFNRITYICTELLNTHPDEKYERTCIS